MAKFLFRMNINSKYLIILAVALLLTSCNNSKKEVIQPVIETEILKNAQTESQKLFLEYNSELVESLKIYNSKKSEYTVKVDDIFGRSTEGGHITREYKSDKFIAYTSFIFGEMGKTQYDYYSFDEFIYLIETTETYNVPFYLTQEKVIEEELNMESFDPQKSTVSTKEFIKDGTYLYRIDREKQDLIIVQDTEEINTFNLCQQDVSIEFTIPPLSFSKYNIFAVNSLLLGGYFENKWIDDEVLFSMIEETEAFKTYINSSFKGVVKGAKVASAAETIYNGNYINFEHNQYDGTNDVFAFSGLADLNIEYGEELSVDSDVYRNALIEYMISEGYRGELLLNRILKIDIDKDGTDEVFISASNLPDLSQPEYGDEVLYMRKIVDGEVKNIMFPIAEPINSSDMKKIIGFCDLNGDGVNEIVVKIRGIGYEGCAVFELKEDRVIRIFANGSDC